MVNGFLLQPSRQRLEEDFEEAGIHSNLRRLLTSWDTNPVKTKEALVLLTHLLLQRTPPRQKIPDYQQGSLSDTFANLDLLFQWMVESCFTADTLDPEVVSQGMSYSFFLLFGSAQASVSDLSMVLGLLTYKNKPFGFFVF